MRSPLHLSHSSGTSGTISVSLGLSAAAAPGSVSLLALEVEPTSARRRLGVGSFALSFFWGGHWRVNSGIVEADAASVCILEFFLRVVQLFVCRCWSSRQDFQHISLEQPCWF